MSVRKGDRQKKARQRLHHLLQLNFSGLLALLLLWSLTCPPRFKARTTDIAYMKSKSTIYKNSTFNGKYCATILGKGKEKYSKI
jgi:hypothetical protein